MLKYLIVALLMAASAAQAQVSVLQGGPFVPGHMPMYTGNGYSQQPVVVDGGPASGGPAGANPKELGLTASGTGTGAYGANACDYDAPSTSSSGRHFVCYVPAMPGGSGGALIYGSDGAAAPLPFQFIVNGQVYPVTPDVYKGSTLQNLHTVVWTVAPAGATAADKAHADFVADGVNDQVAIQAAVAQATGGDVTVPTNAEVRLLPGVYHLSAPAYLNAGSSFVFNAQGTDITGVSNTDAIQIGGGNHSHYNLGVVRTTGTGSAVRLRGNSTIGGLTEGTVTWQALLGGGGGNGLYLDATGAGAALGVNYFWGTEISGFSNGIIEVSTTNIDTNVFNVNYIHNCNICVYIHTAAGNSINSQQWNVNVDTTVIGGAIGVETNEVYGIYNVTISPCTGANTCTAIQLDSGAHNNDLNFTPWPLSSLGTNVPQIIDNSGVANNRWHVGATLAPAAGPSTSSLGHVVQWSGSDLGVIADTGFALSQGPTASTFAVRTSGGNLVSNNYLGPNALGTESVALESQGSGYVQLGTYTGVEGGLRVGSASGSAAATNGISINPGKSGSGVNLFVDDLTGTGDSNISLGIFSKGTQTLSLGTGSGTPQLSIQNSGILLFPQTGSFMANGTTAASLGSTSPGHATPQKYLQIQDNSNATYFIPLF